MAESGAKLVGNLTTTRDARIHAIRKTKQRHYYLQHGFKAEEVMSIVAQCREQGMSLAQVATRLNDQGYTSMKGTRFYPNSIKRLIDDPPKEQ